MLFACIYSYEGTIEFLYLCVFWFFYQHINGMAPIRLVKYGSVDMDFVLGIGGYDLERLLPALLHPAIMSLTCNS